MTANTISSELGTTTQETTAGDESRATFAVAVRRWLLIASPVLAGLFAVVGAAADPGAGISGREMYELYVENPDPLRSSRSGSTGRTRSGSPRRCSSPATCAEEARGWRTSPGFSASSG